LILARGTPNGRGEGGAVWPSIIVKGASHLWRRSGAAGGGGFMPLNGVVSDHKQQGDLLLAPIWFIRDHNRLDDPVSALSGSFAITSNEVTCSWLGSGPFPITIV
jgi:hypothetical protein